MTVLNVLKIGDLLIDMELIYNVVLVLGVQQSDSVIFIYFSNSSINLYSLYILFI